MCYTRLRRHTNKKWFVADKCVTSNTKLQSIFVFTIDSVKMSMEKTPSTSSAFSLFLSSSWREYIFSRIKVTRVNQYTWSKCWFVVCCAFVSIDFILCVVSYSISMLWTLTFRRLEKKGMKGMEWNAATTFQPQFFSFDLIDMIRSRNVCRWAVKVLMFVLINCWPFLPMALCTRQIGHTPWKKCQMS